ncbi:MAG: FecR domain-containing protein [Patescibacteria group bacterium]
MKKSFIIFTLVKFSTLFLFSYFLVKLLVPGKVQAYTEQDCVNVAVNCVNRCVNSINVENINVNNLDPLANACAQKCINEITAYCGNIGNSQPQVQQPQEEQPQKPQEQLPTAVPQESLPRTVTKGQYFEESLSDDLVALLGPDSSGGPYSFNLDTMGGFPPMGLILGPDGVLRGTPTGKDSKFRACVKDAGGNTACKVINIDVKKEGEPESVVPGNFRLTELAYNNLPYGKQYQSSQYERAVINMPDGSLMYMDKNSTITPVSDYEVKSDTGRFMYDYKPASGGGCGPIGQSPTWACRQVDARDATLRVKGTEFAVDTDEYGTNITVMEGVLSVSDPNGNKTVEVAGGQYTYIAKWGLPTDPQSFDTSQVDFWWKEKTAEQIKSERIINYTAIFLVVFLFILFIKRKQIWPKRFGKPVHTVVPEIKGENKKTIDSKYEGLAVMAFLIGCVAVAVPLNLLVEFFPLPPLIIVFVTSPAFFAVNIVGLIFGIIAFKSSKKSFAIFIIILNIVGIVLGPLFGF